MKQQQVSMTGWTFKEHMDEAASLMQKAANETVPSIVQALAARSQAHTLHAYVLSNPGRGVLPYLS